MCAYMTVRRFDRGELRKARRDSRGFLRVPAAVTRTGVFSYRTADGKTVRELRHPDEVFSEKSLETLQGAPVTVEHPSEFVTPGNASELEIGVVGDDVRQDGRLVQTELQIRRADAINDVETGILVEISCGYDCDVNLESGVFNGERYDQKQINIRYNHVAAGPKGWGRAGAEVRMRLDSGDAVLEDVVDVPNQETHMIRIDGVDFDAPEQTAKVVEKRLTDLQSNLDEGVAREDDLQKRLDSLEAERDLLKKDLDEARDEARLDSLVEARSNLHMAAKKTLGDDAVLSGLSARDIHEKVVAALSPDTRLDGRSDEYVLATFEILTSNSQLRTDSQDKDLLDASKATSEEIVVEEVSRLDSAFAKRFNLSKKED